MTQSEFKAWFSGFTESMDGPPSLKQWERIQARVKEISGAPTSYPVFVDRYWPQAANPWRLQQGIVPLSSNNMHPVAYAGCNSAASREGVNYTTLQAGHCDGAVGHIAFDSHAAMNALGKTDANALAA